jgi:SAM-dependent methyltransferase
MDVAQGCMNRFRPLEGTNSYRGELGVNPLDCIPAGGYWLDIGCGAAVAVRQAARRRPDIHVVAVDLLPALQDGKPPPRNLRLVQADAACLPLRSRFHLITAVHVLHFLDDKLGCLEQWANFLQPGGRLLANADPDDIAIGETWESARGAPGKPGLAMRWERRSPPLATRVRREVNRFGVRSVQSLYPDGFIEFPGT